MKTFNPLFIILARFLVTVPLLTTLHARAVEEGIHWQDWSASVFARAKAQNRPILLNVGHEGCTACLFMERNTFSDAAVIALVNRHFVAIQVDSEARPDIGERYSDWAWPANVFLAPDGTQVLAFAGSRRPASYLQVLREIIDKHNAGDLSPDVLAPYGAAEQVNTDPLTPLRDQLRNLHERFHRQQTGGVFESAESLRHLLLRKHLYGDEEAGRLAKTALDRYLGQLDPVWGGMFYASFDQGRRIATEKRLESQAAALQAYAQAYQVFGDDRYRDAIANVDRYLNEFMRASDGGYFANQQDRFATAVGDISMDEFYALDDENRRRYGIPSIDHAVYSDVNARVILGYVMAHQATGKQAYLDRASAAAKQLLEKRQTREGWLQQLVLDDHLSGDQRIHRLHEQALPYLRVQAHFGQALLALHGATGEPVWTEAAAKLADALLTALEDASLGGFYGGPDDGTPGRRKPLEDNAAAAQFLYLLGVLRKDDRYKNAAERAVRAVTSPVAVSREGRITGNLLLVLEIMTAGYVELSVVGRPGDPATEALLKAGREVYEPRKLVHQEAPGRYPLRDRAAMYICNDQRCSLPVYDPARVATEAARFTYRPAPPD